MADCSFTFIAMVNGLVTFFAPVLAGLGTVTGPQVDSNSPETPLRDNTPFGERML